ncbi:MAG: FAD-dependent thymidylate synthase [Candidatus Odinarchaeota archaeon]
MKVKLLGSFGSDIDIDRAARMSFGEFIEERSEIQVNRLIRYLMWNRHTSPFEMVEFKFYLKIPIFVARQLVRHRTASLNEISRRYTDRNVEIASDLEFREVDDSKTKQGSGSVLFTLNDHPELQNHFKESLNLYHELIDGKGVANECARAVLPLSTMTEWIWKIDLHNLLHFLLLRLDSHAQKETRLVAGEILELIRPVVPITVKAFEDWRYYITQFREKGYEYFRTGTRVDIEFIDKNEI